MLVICCDSNVSNSGSNWPNNKEVCALLHKMSQREHVDLLRMDVNVWNALRSAVESESVVSVSYGIDLQGVDLSGAELLNFVDTRNANFMWGLACVGPVCA